jgi:protein-disulfide isomerase
VITWLHFSGATNSDTLWIEYSDLWCGACKQFHTSGITEDAFKKYETSLSKAMVWFLSVGGPTSLAAMEAISCMAEQKNELHSLAWDNFYKLVIILLLL